MAASANFSEAAILMRKIGFMIVLMQRLRHTTGFGFTLYLLFRCPTAAYIHPWHRQSF